MSTLVHALNDSDWIIVRMVSKGSLPAIDYLNVRRPQAYAIWLQPLSYGSVCTCMEASNSVFNIFCKHACHAYKEIQPELQLLTVAV